MKFKLLTIGNPKTAKGQARNYLTGVLHLAPFNLSGVNVCPMAEIAGCVKACLNTAGRGGIAKGGIVTQESVKTGRLTNKIQECRIRRTRLFLEHREDFLQLLVQDIRKLVFTAKKLGLKPAVRLNGTSDIRWEDIPVNGVAAMGFNRGWTVDCKNIFEAFSDVQFYDYTKIPNRRRALDIPNYHLTFSYSGAPAYQPYVERALQNYGNKVNVAVVFGKNLTIPETFLDRSVINGDEHDLRFLDPKGVVVALTAKGNGKKDDSGFVVR
jgi:hypothetical protein